MRVRPIKMFSIGFAIASVLARTAYAEDQGPVVSSTEIRPMVPSTELNTVLMHATFEIFGPAVNKSGQNNFGTVFVLSNPLKDDPKHGNIVIVTAAHVLDEIGGDTATLIVRQPTADGTYISFPYQLPIRKDGKPLYTKHVSADVAVMYAALPFTVPISGLIPDFLVDDKRLKDLEIHPGDEVFVLGFPLAAQSPGAFPILRSGHIASYPLVPQNVVKQIDLDVFLFGGNSGGPVYYSYPNRTYGGSVHFGLDQGILGLIIQSTSSMLPGYIGTSLNFGVVLPAQYIREAIESLPPAPLFVPTVTPSEVPSPLFKPVAPPSEVPAPPASPQAPSPNRVP